MKQSKRFFSNQTRTHLNTQKLQACLKNLKKNKSINIKKQYNLYRVPITTGFPHSWFSSHSTFTISMSNNCEGKYCYEKLLFALLYSNIKFYMNPFKNVNGTTIIKFFKTDCISARKKLKKVIINFFLKLID